jgi:hypothetical protein
MAVAPARRGPDIIQAQPIPLSAVSDQPLPGAIAPPTSASAHPDDLASGVAKEITAEELAAGDTARRGVDPAEAEAANVPAKKADAVDSAKPADKPTDKADDAFDDGIVVPPGLPGYANREIASIRKRARDLVQAAQKTAKGEAGEADWQKLYEANRDTIVAKANQDAAKAVKTAKDAQDVAEAAKRELDELRTKVAADPKPEQADPKPARASFDDPDAYDDAVAAWGKREGKREADAARKTDLEAAAEVERAKTALETAQKAEDDRKAQEAEILKVQDSWTAARTKAIEKYADYAEVAEAAPEDGGPTITDAMAAAILQVDNGTDVAYHLGQNTEESERIAKIGNPVRQFIEIGRIAERLATPQRQARRARPVEHINDAPNPADTTEAEPDMETYARQRNAQLQKARQPFFPAGGLH